MLRHKRMAAGTPDLAVRRQIAFELGPDAEPTSDQKFQLLQKYGVAAARIDRGVTKPKWMTEGRWKTLKAEWFQLTKGLVPKEQFKRHLPNLPASKVVPYPKKFSANLKQLPPQQSRRNSNASPRSYDRTRTETRQQ